MPNFKTHISHWPIFPKIGGQLDNVPFNLYSKIYADRSLLRFIMNF